MTQSPFIKAEDASRKGFDFSPWGGIEGFLKASQAGGMGNAAVLKRLVPDLAHAVDMTAVAISSLPFEIVEESGAVFDTSEDWKNKLGGLNNPQRLIYLLASSLCGGCAYVIPEATNRAIINLQYAAPHTITAQINMQGLQYFDRANDQGKTDRFQPEELIYFWLPDSDVEIGPAQNHPLGNAMLDAQMIWAMKNTMKIYGDRGFVPITLLGAKGMVAEGERQKAEAFFDRLLRGGFDVLAKIINSEALSIVPIGAGMEQLKQSYLEIRRDAKESIADAFGIPSAIFMSDKAFASEFDALMLQWYTDSRFVGIYQTIQETLTDQLFARYGKKMLFRLDTLDVFQEDEAERSKSLSDFVSAVVADPETAQLGMSILGYEMDKKQEGLLAAIVSRKEEEKKQEQDLAKQAAQQPQVQNSPAQNQPKPKPPAKAVDLSADELKDLALWYGKSKAWFLKNKGTAVDWENKHLREEIAAPIRLKLAEAKSELDIALAFQLDGNETETAAPEYKSSELMVLADALNNYAKSATQSALMIEALKAISHPTAEKKDDMQITINNPASVDMTSKETIEAVKTMTEHFAELKQAITVTAPPSVTFAPVIQPSEVINQNNISVEPTPVKIENNTTVTPADVTIMPQPDEKKEVTIRIERDNRGLIKGATGEIDAS